jgi:hypothetical protein
MRIEIIFEEEQQYEAAVAINAQKLLSTLQDIDNAARSVLKHGGNPEATLQHIRSLVSEATAFLE